MSETDVKLSMFDRIGDVFGDRIGLAQVAAARVERAACIAVPIHKEAFCNRHETFPSAGCGSNGCNCAQRTRAKFLPANILLNDRRVSIASHCRKSDNSFRQR
jgi:hypothetical protein